MTATKLFLDKTTTAKQKSAILTTWLIEKSIDIDELISLLENLKESNRATGMEAFEFATRQNSDFGHENLLDFATANLSAKAPRLKWESAKVIGNIAVNHPGNLEKPISELLKNTQHDVTVVRWSASFALSEIIKLTTSHNKTLVEQAKKSVKPNKKTASKKSICPLSKKHRFSKTLASSTAQID